MITKYIRMALITLVLVLIGFIVFYFAALLSFSDLTEKQLIFSLKEGNSNYELYYVFQGALGSDVVQTVINGDVYSNEEVRGLNDARIESIIIKDSILINMVIEDECVPIRIPL